jgi:hypothetical protein
MLILSGAAAIVLWWIWMQKSAAATAVLPYKGLLERHVFIEKDKSFDIAAGSFNSFFSDYWLGQFPFLAKRLSEPLSAVDKAVLKAASGPGEYAVGGQALISRLEPVITSLDAAIVEKLVYSETDVISAVKHVERYARQLLHRGRAEEACLLIGLFDTPGMRRLLYDVCIGLYQREAYVCAMKLLKQLRGDHAGMLMQSFLVAARHGRTFAAMDDGTYMVDKGGSLRYTDCFQRNRPEVFERIKQFPGSLCALAKSEDDLSAITVQGRVFTTKEYDLGGIEGACAIVSAGPLAIYHWQGGLTIFPEAGRPFTVAGAVQACFKSDRYYVLVNDGHIGVYSVGGERLGAIQGGFVSLGGVKEVFALRSDGKAFRLNGLEAEEVSGDSERRLYCFLCAAWGDYVGSGAKLYAALAGLGESAGAVADVDGGWKAVLHEDGTVKSYGQMMECRYTGLKKNNGFIYNHFDYDLGKYRDIVDMEGSESHFLLLNREGRLFAEGSDCHLQYIGCRSDNGYGLVYDRKTEISSFPQARMPLRHLFMEAKDCE